MCTSSCECERCKYGFSGISFTEKPTSPLDHLQKCESTRRISLRADLESVSLKNGTSCLYLAQLEISRCSEPFPRHFAPNASLSPRFVAQFAYSIVSFILFVASRTGYEHEPSALGEFDLMDFSNSALELFLLLWAPEQLHTMHIEVIHPFAKLLHRKIASLAWKLTNSTKIPLPYHKTHSRASPLA